MVLDIIVPALILAFCGAAILGHVLLFRALLSPRTDSRDGKAFDACIPSSGFRATEGGGR